MVALSCGLPQMGKERLSVICGSRTKLDGTKIKSKTTMVKRWVKEFAICRSLETSLKIGWCGFMLTMESTPRSQLSPSSFLGNLDVVPIDYIGC